MKVNKINLPQFSGSYLCEFTKQNEDKNSKTIYKMKKIIVAATLAAGLISAVGASAAKPTTATTATRQVAACAQTVADTCNRACPAPRFNPFEGIELTADQQTAIQNLDNSRRQNRESARRDGRNERQERRDAARAARSQERRDYLAQLKTILTPEQYVTFLENSYLNAPAPPQPGRDGRRGHDARHDRRDNRGDRQQPARQEARR